MIEVYCHVCERLHNIDENLYDLDHRPKKVFGGEMYYVVSCVDENGVPLHSENEIKEAYESFCKTRLQELKSNITQLMTKEMLENEEELFKIAFIGFVEQYPATEMLVYEYLYQTISKLHTNKVNISLYLDKCNKEISKKLPSKSGCL